MSTLGRKYSYCATLETNEYAGWPPAMMPTSNEVPPMSVVMMFEKYISRLQYSGTVAPRHGARVQRQQWRFHRLVHRDRAARALRDLQRLRVTRRLELPIEV